MRVPVLAKSVVTAVKATAAIVDLPLDPGALYELAVTHDTWARQSLGTEACDAVAGESGSMLLFKGRVVTISGYHGSFLSLVRDKTDGLAVLTPLAEV